MVCRALGSLLLSPMPSLHADSIRKPTVSVFYLVTQHVSSSLLLIWKTCPDSSDLSRSPLCPPKFQATYVVALMVTRVINHWFISFLLASELHGSEDLVSFMCCPVPVTMPGSDRAFDSRYGGGPGWRLGILGCIWLDFVLKELTI